MPKPEDQIVVVAHFIAVEGKENELLAVLHRLIEPTRKEPGCLRYELNQEADNPRAFTFAEKFASREAFDAHTKTPHIGRFRQESQGLIESREVRLHRELLPVGGQTHA